MNRHMNTSSKKFTSFMLAFMVCLSVFAGAFAGTAAASHAANDADATLTDGTTYWVGQTLDKTDATEGTYEITGADESNSDYFQQVAADADGHLMFETEDMPAGSYVLQPEGDDGTNAVEFRVAEQTFSVEEVEDTDADDMKHTFEVDSNRVNFDVVVEAEGLDITETAELFGEDAVAEDSDEDGEDDRVVISDLSDGSKIVASFSEEQVDTYDFTFTVEDTEVSDSIEDFTVTEAADANAEFDKGLYSDEEGDVAEFTIDLENAESAIVHFGSEDIGYEASIKVTDGDEDGKVTVLFNSLNAGVGGAANTFDANNSKDSVTVEAEETTISSPPLDTGTYDISVETTDGRETDVASLVLNERSTDGVSIHAVPAAEHISEAADVDGLLSGEDNVAIDDKFVAVLSGTGLEATLGDATMNDLPEGVEVIVEETEPGINAEARTLDESNANLYADGDNDTYYIVFDTSDYTLEDGDEFEVRFNVTEAFDYAEDTDEADAESASAVVSFADNEVEFDGYDDVEEIVYVTPGGNYTLSGTTTAAPGTNFTVVARSTGDAPFLFSEEVTVSEDGTFAAEFDFSALKEGHNFTVQVRGYDAVDATTEAPRYTLDVTATDENGEALDADISVNGEAYDGAMDLEAGNYTVEASADGYAPASQDVSLDGDASVTLELVDNTHDLTVNVVDENGSAIENASVNVGGQSLAAGETLTLEDGAYTVEASADGYDAASKEITLDGAAQTVSVTLMEAEEPVDNETETPTPAPEPSDTNNSSEEPETPNPGQPGFGVVVSLVALLAAALLAFRRQD